MNMQITTVTPTFVEVPADNFLRIEEATDQELRAAERRLRKQARVLLREADGLKALREHRS